MNQELVSPKFVQGWKRSYDEQQIINNLVPVCANHQSKSQLAEQKHMPFAQVLSKTLAFLGPWPPH